MSIHPPLPGPREKTWTETRDSSDTLLACSPGVRSCCSQRFSSISTSQSETTLSLGFPWLLVGNGWMEKLPGNVCTFWSHVKRGWGAQGKIVIKTTFCLTLFLFLSRTRQQHAIILLARGHLASTFGWAQEWRTQEFVTGMARPSSSQDSLCVI